MVKRFFKTSGKFALTVAQALMPAASTIVSTPGSLPKLVCRQECRHGRHECLRHEGA